MPFSKTKTLYKENKELRLKNKSLRRQQSPSFAETCASDYDKSQLYCCASKLTVFKLLKYIKVYLHIYIFVKMPVKFYGTRYG